MINKNIKNAGRKCSICKDEKLEEINEMIKSEKHSFRRISLHFFGSISKRDAIRRHAGKCSAKPSLINADMFEFARVVMENRKKRFADDNFGQEFWKR